MALSCPRCQAKVDIGGYAPGSSLRCSECGGLMRVPSGRTGVHPAVQEEAPASPKVSTRLRVKPVGAPESGGTRMRVKPVGSGSETRMRAVAQARRKPSNTGLYIGLSIGAAAVLVVVLLFVMKPGQSAEVAANPRPPAPKPPPARMAGPEPAAPAPAPALPPSEPGRAAVDPSTLIRAGDPAKANWDQIMQMLRPGGGFDDLSRPEGAAFAKVKGMGKSAYPYLVKFIDNEDGMLGRAAVVVLNELTGRTGARPNETTKIQIKAEWDAWLKANP